MAHRFSNFADAYAELADHIATYRSMIDTAFGYASDARDYADSGNWKLGIKYNSYAIGATLSAFDILFQLYSFDIEWSMFGECLYWAAQEGGAADPYILTATKICEAWAKDGFKDRALTIAFIDRQRQLIWDEPFFVAWAAKPEL
ncbi:hypothetical protein ES703_65117 [subsurface metagenome]